MAEIQDTDIADMVRRANANLQAQDMQTGKAHHPAGDPVMSPVRRFYNSILVDAHVSGVMHRFSNLF